MKKSKEIFRTIIKELEGRTVSGADDFWFNGKLWSEMTDDERTETVRLLGYENKDK